MSLLLLSFEIGVDKWHDATIEDGVSIGFLVVGAGVFDETIRLKNIVSDLLTPFGGFASTELIDRFGVLLELHLDELAAEDFHGFFLVLELAALVLDRDYSICRKVGDTNGRVGSVDRLATVSTGVVDINTEVIFVDFDVGVSLNNGENLNQGKGSLAEIISIER